MDDAKRLDDISGFFATLMAAHAKPADPRLERVFNLVPRQAFFPPGPWQIFAAGRYYPTPSADPVYLYQNTLVALNAGKGINNGEPFLHAGWIGAVAPQLGETVVHIGAGTGYYTAILSVLVLPGGRVSAYEIEPGLAAAATANLKPFENVVVFEANAVTAPLPKADIIYVNAGVVAPPVAWLDALKPGGRLICPWRPTERVGIAILIRRVDAGWSVQPLMPSSFIPCVGASDAATGSTAPDYAGAWATRSIRRTADQAPDATATAVYGDVWFSNAGQAVGNRQ